MSGFIETFIDRLLFKLRHALFGVDDKQQYAKNYADLAAQRYGAPQPTADSMQTFFELNAFFTDVALTLATFFIIFYLFRWGIGLVQGPNVVLTGARIVIGTALLAINTELVFAAFRLSTELVEAVMYLRATHMETNAQLGGFVFDALISGPTGVYSYFMLAFTLFFKITSQLVLLGSLLIRWLVLHIVVAIAPIIILTFVFGRAIGLSSIGGKFAFRAIYFPVPLTIGLFAVEVIDLEQMLPGTLLGEAISALLVLGVVWVSVKLSAPGRIITGGLKKGAGAAALAGGAYLLGGSSMVKKAGVARSFGSAGIPLSRTIGNEDQAAAEQGTAAGQDNGPSPFASPPTAGGGAPSDDNRFDFEGASEEQIKNAYQKIGLTPSKEKYANNDRWKADDDLRDHIVQTQDDRGRWLSTHRHPDQALERLSDGTQDARSQGNLMAMEQDTLRTEDEWRAFTAGGGTAGGTYTTGVSSSPTAHDGVRGSKDDIADNS